jgi:hypothetical protein
VPAPAAETIVTGLGPQLPKSAAPGANSPRVVINELMASNSKTAKNPQGKYADWVEIHNPTKEALDLSGVYVTDTDRSPRKWQFAKGTVVQAGGYLVLWADEDGKATNGLHLNFKLSSSTATSAGTRSSTTSGSRSKPTMSPSVAILRSPKNGCRCLPHRGTRTG